ncbi:MAG: ATP-binding cassette domain-containing protein, partial [Proteobacteria bacterium]|nr:ATP-binding cassette domain-containing protein [Pseudomonadota bacterium]
IISVLGIHELLDQPLPKMSLGEQKQIHLARVMASRSTYLLLDEPTACLDPAVSLDFMAWIVRETAIMKRTVIASLHDLALAHEFAHTVSLLADGRVVDFGDPRKIFLNKSMHDTLGVELMASGVRFRRRTPYCLSP